MDGVTAGLKGGSKLLGTGGVQGFCGRVPEPSCGIPGRFLGARPGVWRVLPNIVKGVWVSAKPALTFKLIKTHLNMPSATFLWHMVDATGRYPCVEKVKANMEKEYPEADVTTVRSFIGMTQYYRNYISDYANKVAPLHALTRKGVNVPASWPEKHERAADTLKKDLSMRLSLPDEREQQSAVSGACGCMPECCCNRMTRGRLAACPGH